MVGEDNHITTTELGETLSGKETKINKQGVVLVDSATEQNNAPGVVLSSVSVQSYQAGNDIIRAGAVELHKISQYLTDLPADAKAELLVAPQDLANIDGYGLGTWGNSVRRIRQIKGYYGLDGMKVYGRPWSSHDHDILEGNYDGLRGYKHLSYEEDLANQIKAAFAQAKDSGEVFTTGLFMPTKELVHGRAINSWNITVENNLHNLAEKIAEQGDAFVTGLGSGYLSHWYRTATEWSDKSAMYCVRFSGLSYYYGPYDCRDYRDPQNYNNVSSRLVALAIQP